MTTAQILTSVGPVPIADWFVHFSAMCVFSALHGAAPALRPYTEQLPPAEAYAWERRFEAWQYGSGLDYVAEEVAPLEPAALARAKKAVEASRARAELITK